MKSKKKVIDFFFFLLPTIPIAYNYGNALWCRRRVHSNEECRFRRTWHYFFVTRFRKRLFGRPMKNASFPFLSFSVTSSERRRCEHALGFQSEITDLDQHLFSHRLHKHHYTEMFVSFWNDIIIAHCNKINNNSKINRAREK